jgi:ferric-dicitrate binding protein FerR (iron transport regulator)
MSEFEDINELIITYISGNATDEEKDYIDSWLQESEVNKRKLAELSQVWESSVSPDDIQVDTDNRYVKLSSRIKENRSFSSKILPFLRYAAIFVFALVLGSLGSIFYQRGTLNQQIPEANTSRIISPLGAKTNIVLSDGTEVWLNAGSTLTYPNQFGILAERNVTLSGEAFFKVSEDKNRPFTVSAEGVIFRVLGTSFNVKAYSDESFIEATLVEGKISVGFENKFDEEIILEPKEQIKINKGSSEILKLGKPVEEPDIEKDPDREIINENIYIQKGVNTLPHTSWKDRRWIIENEQLSSLIKKLERRFSVTIIFKDEKLGELRYTGTLMDESLEQVLEVISFASPIGYEIDGKSVYLYTKK